MHPKPDVAECAAVLRLDAIQIDRLRLEYTRVLEQLALHRTRTKEVLRQCRGLGAPLRIEFAEVGDGLLPHLRSHADRPHQPPVGQRLAVLPDLGVAEVHGRWRALSIPARSISTGLVGTTSLPRDSKNSDPCGTTTSAPAVSC